MNHSNRISVSMFGGRRLAFESQSIDNQTLRSKNTWTLLEYLITHRNRTVTQTELIDLLFPDEKSDAPLNALKTLVHRTRNVLNTLGYADGKQIIRQCAGGYQWNNEIPLDFDVENFENAISEASAPDLDKDAQLQWNLKAIAIYSGDFLPDSAFETWIVPISSYYRYLYMNTVNQALDTLVERGRYGEVISISQNAIAIDPYEEHLYYYLILALASANQLLNAKVQYENMAKLFYSEFGVAPSPDLQILYGNLLSSNHSVETDLGIIKSQMKKDICCTGAFYCEYEFFKDIYRLEVQSSARNGLPIHICLMSADGKAGLTLSKRCLNSVMPKLAGCIKESLRNGDIFSRYSVCQYVVLLPNANFENSEAVMTRIINAYKRQYPHSQAVITYSTQTIDTSK